MQALQRKIRDGREYGHLFPKAQGGTEKVKSNATLEDTLALLPDAVRRFAWQAAGIAARLRGEGLRDTCRNVWEFCYHHFQYKPDAWPKEQIRTPARSWHDRVAGIDCDCYSVLISCILSNLGIPHRFRIAKYDIPGERDPPFQHIYVVVPTEDGCIIIDPVTDRFDHEVPPRQTREIRMDLEILNGTPARGIDQRDLFGGGLGATAPVSNKLNRVEAEAKAKGMTLAEYQAASREEFIQKNGMTPEQWAAQLQANIKTANTAADAAQAAELAKARAELQKRGVAVPPNATRDQLVQLLRENPAPKPGGQALHTINQANPATVLLRTGLILAMKVNLLGTAGKLRWAFATPEQARRAGLSDSDHAKVGEAWERLRKLHYGAGGDPQQLMQAIQSGKGNKDGAIALNGLPAILGEPVSTAAAIGAATAAVTAIAAIVKEVKAPATQAGGVADLPASGEAAASLPVARQTTDPTSPITAEVEGEAPASPEAPKGMLQKAVDWAKENPFLAAGVGLLAVGGTALAVKALSGGKPKTAALAGTPPALGKPRRRKPAGKPKKGKRKRKGKGKGRKPSLNGIKTYRIP
jgi:hypothetical protein